MGIGIRLENVEFITCPTCGQDYDEDEIFEDVNDPPCFGCVQCDCGDSFYFERNENGTYLISEGT